MKTFLKGLQSGSVARGRPPNDLLNEDEQREFRSVAGCLQWVAGQARPEVAITLHNRGRKTMVSDLKTLYSTVDFLKETPDRGMLVTNVPLNKRSMLVTYTDASFANAEYSSSQLGVLVCLTTPSVRQRTSPVNILDWRSCRSQRVCRSTLASESSAADEGADRSAYANMMLSEICATYQPIEPVASWILCSAQMQNHYMTASSMELPIPRTKDL